MQLTRARAGSKALVSAVEGQENFFAVGGAFCGLS
jgi:hypothetical protein